MSMHLFYIEQYTTLEQKCVLLNGVMWDMEQVHCGI